MTTRFHEPGISPDAADASRKGLAGTPVMMSTRTLQWTTTKTPATKVGQALLDSVDVNNQLLRGIPVSKITTRGKNKPRVVTVSRDVLALFCTHAPIDKKGSNTFSTVATKLPLPMFSRKGVMGFTGHLRERYVRYMDVADLDYVTTSTIGTRKLESSRTQNRLKGKDSKIDVVRRNIVSIGHHGDQTFDILVPDQDERTTLVSVIQQMRATYHEAAQTCSHEALLLRYIWYDVDVNRDGKISEKEFIKILNRINLSVKQPSKVYNRFCKDHKLKKVGLQLHEILGLLQRIKRNQGSMGDILWNILFTSGEDKVTAQEFLTKFVHGQQKETHKTLEDVRELFVKLNSMELNHRVGEPEGIIVDENLSRARFEVFLYHELNDAFDPASQEAPQKPLNEPMAAYFINTSHNTYLTGDQLQSNSSVEMYARALRRGCKCLELDCWDGESKPKADLSNVHPVVFHGHTLTSKILFEDILRVVKNYLDDFPGTYPIILSLENHCSHPFQKAMAKLLTETFENKLYVPSGKAEEDLPSPEKLKGMIVIKGKRPPEPDDAPEISEANTEEEDDPYDNTTPDETPKKSKDGKPAKPPKVVPELARLTLFHGTKWKSFEQSIGEPRSHMHSIGESKIGKILTKKAENASLWRQYNDHHMTRTYPAGARVDSSNYNPVVAWGMGCQLVALNFQTNDAPLILNDGLFRQNNGVGYLRKPVLKTYAEKTMTLKIRVLSGSCLPKPYGAKGGEFIDPYVQVTVHDIRGTSYTTATHSTPSIADNGFCPVWNEKDAKSFDIYNPEIAMVQFGLREADIALSENVGYASVPVHCLRSGYRSIQLYDKNNTRTGPFSFASLLIHIETE